MMILRRFGSGPCVFFDHFHGISWGHLDLPSRRACTALPWIFELTLSPAVLSLFLSVSLIYIYCKAFIFQAPIPLERGKELPHGRAWIL